MAQLNWSEPARRDMEEIIRYYESLSHKTALFYSEEILNAGDRLMLMPEMGPKDPLLEHPTETTAMSLYCADINSFISTKTKLVLSSWFGTADKTQND